MTDVDIDADIEPPMEPEGPWLVRDFYCRLCYHSVSWCRSWNLCCAQMCMLWLEQWRNSISV